MAWSIPNLIFFLIKLIKKNPKIFPIIISVIISVVGLIFSITFLKSIAFFETIDNSKEIMEIMENCSNYSKEELDDCFFLISELIQIVNFGFILITHLTILKSLKQLEESTMEK